MGYLCGCSGFAWGSEVPRTPSRRNSENGSTRYLGEYGQEEGRASGHGRERRGRGKCSGSCIAPLAPTPAGSLEWETRARGLQGELSRQSASLEKHEPVSP